VPATQKVDSYRTNLLVTKLTGLALADIRRKPTGVTAALTAAGARRFQQAEIADLARKGFYLSADGELLSNQGEVVVHTSTGIFYVLRFGEVSYEPRDSRYVFISVGLDPKNVSAKATKDELKRLELLRARFAPWYYLISDADFKGIRLQRTDLLRKQAADAPQ
jgi:hypothetical protein